MSPPQYDSAGRPTADLSTAERPTTDDTTTVAEPCATIDRDGVIVRPVSACERAARFTMDRELQAMARTLAQAHAFVLTACVPRSLRRDLGGIVADLDRVLHGGPHLGSAR